MCAVNYKFWFIAYFFKPAVPYRVFQTVLYIIFAHTVNMPAHFFRNGGIFALIFTVKRYFIFRHAVGLYKSCIFFTALVFYDIHHTIFLFCRNDKSVVFYNTRLLICDFFKRVAEEFHMVHTYRSYHRYKTFRNNIGCVLTSAHTDFNQNNVTLFFFKIQKCHCRFHFKRCRVRSHFVRNFTDTAYIISISVLTHIFCIYTKLFKIIKNRR